MKRLLTLALLAITLTTRAADPVADSLTGHYELAKRSNAPLSFDVLQKGKSATTSFSAAHSDGSGAAPDGDGEGSLNAKGELEFKWTDTFGNAGTGSFRREGKLYHLSLKTTKVVDPRATVFYGEIALKRTSTKPQMSTR
ncbi:MAG: hypothetical protein WDN28_29595 [Chthoniobacter sp.]